MAARTNFTTEEARRVDKHIGIDRASAPFDVEQLRSGKEVELERGGRGSSSATRWRSGRRAAANALTTALVERVALPPEGDRRCS
jgi:hypothetical protein